MTTPTYANVSNQIAALKELYDDPQFVMKDLIFKRNPFLALVPKDESTAGFVGKYFPVPLVYGAPQGRSATFANAQSQQTAAALASFLVYRVSNYEVVTITNELLEATKDNAGAFVDEAKLHMDTGFRNITNDLAADLFGTGTGSRGQISSITLSGANTSVVIDLTNQADTTKFEVGMLMVASATDGSAPSSDTVLISQIDRIDGILTGISSVSPSNTLSANWAANGFLSVAGDLPAGGASGTGSFLKVSGLSAWVPSVAPVSGSSFWNVDRSPDQRLYGIFKDYSDRPIEEALIDLNAQMYLMGASSDYVFVNPISYASLEKSLGAKVQYVDVHHDEVDISFEGIQISGQTGKLTVIADRNCPAQTAFMLQLDTWKVKSLGKAPHVLTYGLEGLEGLRVGTADALEIRIGYYGNLCSNAPGWNGRCKLSM